MGDRGNIKIGKIFLYTHSDGSWIKEILQRALKRRIRWNDEAFLTRIIFGEMVKDCVLGEHGFGISTGIVDNDCHTIPIVCVKDQTVDIDGIIFTFEEFINLKLKQYEVNNK